MQSFLSFGRFHIPVFGLFAAVGLICAMVLGQRTARLARIDRDAFWDAGMVAVFAAFVLSRALLVVENLRTFVMYPVLVLELPSLTAGGVALTAIVLVLYLRRRHLPLLNVLDASAPCAALLWAFLSLGRFADGTRDGLPATVPWAVASSFGRVHPAEIYSAMLWIVLCAALLWILRHARRDGETAALGLVLGGMMLVFMEFYRLPGILYGISLLDGEQWHGIAMMIAGSLLLAWRVGTAARDTKGVGDAV